MQDQIKWEVKFYTLSDSEGNIFYVGCTKQSLQVRFNEHISGAMTSLKYSNRSRKDAKIVELDFNVSATVIDIRFLEGKDNNEITRLAREIEKGYVKKYVLLGYDLCNKEARKINMPKEPATDFVGHTITAKSGKLFL